MTDFNPTELLSKPLDQIKAPVQYPVGSYVAIATKYEFDKAKNEKATTIVRFTVQYREALPDVDKEDLAQALDEKQGGKPFHLSEDRLEFWLTPDALHRLKAFGMDHCKVPESEVSNTQEMLEAILGRPFIAVRAQKPNKKNPERPYINIDSTAALPD